LDAALLKRRPPIAVGLILEDKRYAVLSDILGDEDRLGDMDFKVAAPTRCDLAADGHQDHRHHRGRSLQVALAQAKDGRIHV
jgi:polyribonucleotide nucleotidyltransferase